MSEAELVYKLHTLYEEMRQMPYEVGRRSRYNDLHLMLEEGYGRVFHYYWKDERDRLIAEWKVNSEIESILLRGKG